MLTKKGTAKCDHCGQFVSWFDIENEIARGRWYEWCETTLGGPEMHDEFEVICLTCLRKRRNNEEYIAQLIKKIKEA
jgi:hypothetical protein